MHETIIDLTQKNWFAMQKFSANLVHAHEQTGIDTQHATSHNILSFSSV